jgi:hypothetical protein
VYWADNGGNSILRVPLAGGSVTTIASANSPWSVAIDSTNIYWTTSQAAVGKAPLGGGTATMLVPPGTPTLVRPSFDLAVDATGVYWIDGAGTLQKVGLAGGMAIPLVPPSAVGNEVGIAVYGGNVYYTDSTRNWVQQTSTAGGTPAPLAMFQLGVSGIVADATGVYWAANETPALMKLPLGGAPMPLANTMATSMAVDRDNFYWLNYTGIARVPKAGGAMTHLVGSCSGQALASETYSLALDPAGVYVSTSDGILRINPK